MNDRHGHPQTISRVSTSGQRQRCPKAHVTFVRERVNRDSPLLRAAYFSGATEWKADRVKGKPVEHERKWTLAIARYRTDQINS